MNIEKALFPNSGKLITHGDIVGSVIVDAEIDPINCVFNNDYCIEIDTEDYTHVVLTVENLENMISLIQEASEYYNNKNM